MSVLSANKECRELFHKFHGGKSNSKHEDSRQCENPERIYGVDENGGKVENRADERGSANHHEEIFASFGPREAFQGIFSLCYVLHDDARR